MKFLHVWRMSNPYRKLPSLAALAGFEAAARLGSFSKAAAELNMTQSAVSHQIKTLEEQLGQPLFRRIHRRVDLTDAGRDLYQTATEALETTRRGVRRLEAYSKPQSVVLHLPPDLARMWLLPRLAQFRARHPDIDPWVYTSEEAKRPGEDEVSISINRQAETGPDLCSRPWAGDQFMAMASPEIIEQWEGDMSNAPLLHDERPEDWQLWYERSGLSRAEFSSGPNFSDSAMILDAAARGMGFALGSMLLAAPLLQSGRLKTHGTTILAVGAPYVLQTTERELARDQTQRLWNWLIEQAPC